MPKSLFTRSQFDESIKPDGREGPVLGSYDSAPAPLHKSKIFNFNFKRTKTDDSYAKHSESFLQNLSYQEFLSNFLKETQQNDNVTLKIRDSFEEIICELLKENPDLEVYNDVTKMYKLENSLNAQIVSPLNVSATLSFKQLTSFCVATNGFQLFCLALIAIIQSKSNIKRYKRVLKFLKKHHVSILNDFFSFPKIKLRLKTNKTVLEMLETRIISGHELQEIYKYGLLFVDYGIIKIVSEETGDLLMNISRERQVLLNICLHGEDFLVVLDQSSAFLENYSSLLKNPELIKYSADFVLGLIDECGVQGLLERLDLDISETAFSFPVQKDQNPMVKAFLFRRKKIKVSSHAGFVSFTVLSVDNCKAILNDSDKFRLMSNEFVETTRKANKERSRTAKRSLKEIHIFVRRKILYSLVEVVNTNDREKVTDVLLDTKLDEFFMTDFKFLKERYKTRNPSEIRLADKIYNILSTTFIKWDYSNLLQICCVNKKSHSLEALLMLSEDLNLAMKADFFLGVDPAKRSLCFFFSSVIHDGDCFAAVVNAMRREQALLNEGLSKVDEFGNNILHHIFLTRSFSALSALTEDEIHLLLLQKNILGKFPTDL